MKWKYLCLHDWTQPRALWADVYLMPDVPDYKGPSIWLTVDALGDPSDLDHGSDRQALIATGLRKLGNADYHIDGTDMIVRAEDFSKSELLGWVTLWLKETGFEVHDLIDGSLEEFAGTSEHLDMIRRMIQKFGDEDRDPRKGSAA